MRRAKPQEAKTYPKLGDTLEVIFMMVDCLLKPNRSEFLDVASIVKIRLKSL